MKYRRLFGIEVRHAASANGRCRGVNIRPRDDDPSGARMLARHRMLLRPLPGGIEVVIGVVDGAGGEVPALPWQDGFTLGLELQDRGLDFASLAGLPPPRGALRPTFRNDDTAPALQLSKTAARAAPVGPVPEVLAWIEIAGATPGWLAAPPQFTLGLSTRELPWLYYLVTRRAGSEPPRIQSTGRAGSPNFSCKLLTSASTRGGADPVGSALLERHPGARCYRMTSRRALPLGGAARAPLSLSAGNEVLLAELPRPSAASAVMVATGSADRQACLHCIVEY